MSSAPFSGRPKAVLFDMDGTLVDTESLWWQAVDEVATGLGYRLTEADQPDVVGRPVEHTGSYLHRVSGRDRVSGRAGVSGRVGAAAEVSAELGGRFAKLVAEQTVPRPGALRLLDELAEAGVATALVSASPRAVVDLVLTALGRARFTVSVAAGETPNTKPAPDPYLAAARALGVPPGACVAVEDTEVGVASAEAAGVPVIAVPSVAPIAAKPGRLVVASLLAVDLAVLGALVGP